MKAILVLPSLKRKLRGGNCHTVIQPRNVWPGVRKHTGIKRIVFGKGRYSIFETKFSKKITVKQSFSWSLKAENLFELAYLYMRIPQDGYRHIKFVSFPNTYL